MKKALTFKLIALVAIIAFMITLVPQQSEAQVPVNLACILADAIAAWICANMGPAWCALAERTADIICGRN